MVRGEGEGEGVTMEELCILLASVHGRSYFIAPHIGRRRRERRNKETNENLQQPRRLRKKYSCALCTYPLAASAAQTAIHTCTCTYGDGPHGW